MSRLAVGVLGPILAVEGGEERHGLPLCPFPDECADPPDPPRLIQFEGPGRHPGQAYPAMVGCGR